MRNLLLLLILSLLNIQNVHASWLSKNPSLFGIELNSDISEYMQKQCLINHDYIRLGKDNFLFPNFSEKDKTGPQWTNWHYTKSKLPVADGCIEPKVNNNDFFNYKVKIFPKSKKIYSVSALYKKVYKYKKKDLSESFTLQPILPLDPLTGKPKKEKPKYIFLSSSKTQCKEMASKLINIVVKTQKKNGYKFDDIDRNAFSDDISVTGGKRKGSNKNLIKITSVCTINGSGSNRILNEEPYLSETQNFLVKISLSINDISLSNKIKREEDLIKEEKRGNKNKNLNTDGL